MMQKSLQGQAIACNDPTTEQQEFLRCKNPCGFPAVNLGAINVEDISPEFEIDGISDDVFGNLYRVWRGMKLVGTFYQDLNHQWVVQPCDNRVCDCLDTPEQAITVLVACELIGAHYCFDSELAFTSLDDRGM